MKKRTFDIILACVAAVILLLPTLLIAVLVRLTSKGSALYWSNRVGINNDIFKSFCTVFLLCYSSNNSVDSSVECQHFSIIPENNRLHIKFSFVQSLSKKIKSEIEIC
jgi:hypothetical protein